MPFDGNGNYVLPTPSYPAIGGATISSIYRNTIDADLQTALSNCITRDGQSPVTANQPMAGFKHTGLGAGTAAGDSLRYEQLNDLVGSFGWMQSSSVYGAGAAAGVMSSAWTTEGGTNTAKATGRYTAPTAGTYEFKIDFELAAAGAAAAVVVDMLKNAAGSITTSAFSLKAAANTNVQASLTGIATLVAGDYVQGWQSGPTGAGCALQGKIFTARRIA